MTDLDDEVGLTEDTLASPSKRGNGKWKAIWNLDRFWEAMEFRQECSSGRMVGFLWLVISDPEVKQRRQQARENGEIGELSQQSDVGAASQQSESQAKTKGSPNKQRRKPLTGLIIPRQPRLKGGSSSLTGSSSLENMLNEAHDDGLLLTKEGYDQAMQTLLHLDFAKRDVAVQSTCNWIKQVTNIAGAKNDWSMEVTGTAAPAEGSAMLNGSGQVNDLGGIVRKKKRKAEEPATAESHDRAEARVETPSSDTPPVNMLGSGMIRKKPKPAAT